jgi:hemerythrin
MFQWTTENAVGIRQIDEEHRRLFALVERLHRAMLEGQAKAILEELLAKLLDYTCYHFAREEQLMEKVRYPAYLRHRAQHEDLRRKARAMQNRVISGEKTVTIELMCFLMEWLQNHTKTSDREIGNYLRSGGSA